MFLQVWSLLYRNSSFMRKTCFLSLFLGLASIVAVAQSDFTNRLSDAAIFIIDPDIIYDPAYFSISYPNGDVPSDRGVCTDVVIRAYRKLGIDLQKEVHEDMKANFNLYPQNWELTATDKNIDHRRVPNLMTFFSRKGIEKPLSRDASDYEPGDIVCWNLGGGITHIGIVVNKKSFLSAGKGRDSQRFLVVHNIGGGQVAEDILFHYKIIGHYSYSLIEH